MFLTFSWYQNIHFPKDKAQDEISDLRIIFSLGTKKISIADSSQTLTFKKNNA